MTEGNPWLDSVPPPSGGEAPRHQPSSNWTRWVPQQAPHRGAVATAEPVEPLAEPSGPTGPQPHVGMPVDPLPVRSTSRTAQLWLVGAHGGAGESTLAALDEHWRATGHTWPELDAGASAPCVVVARTHSRGLLAARTALTQWAASGAGPSVRLLGLVLVADAPGRLPVPLRDLATVVSGGAPRVWDVPWVEGWRFGDPTVEGAPRPVSKLVSHLRSLASAAAAGASPINREEQS